MRGFVHHIDLSVSDMRRALPFYNAVLGFMGYRLSDDVSDGVTDFHIGTRGGDFCSIGILAAKGANAGRAHDRYSPGLHHLAWTARSRADVDAMHEFLKSIGATILDPPMHYPQYSEGYYAVFFADPDGLKLEYCFVP